jgi:hypothetical protein
MKNEENLSIRWNRDVDMCRLIMDYASYISRIAPEETPAGEKGHARMMTGNDVRVSADLCFLAMALIEERTK